MPKDTKAKLRDLTPDQRNANKGTERGSGQLENSLRDYGAGRSILLDRDNNIIAGNKTAEAAGSIGLENIRIIETDGTEIIAVKRTDLHIDDKKARELAIADNRIGEMNLNWDTDVLSEFIVEGVEVGKFFFDNELNDLLAQTEEPETPDTQTLSERADATPRGSAVLSYNLIFDSSDHQAKFHKFLRYLNKAYPEGETISERLNSYLGDSFDDE